MADTRDYAFIDGNYLRRAYEQSMGRFFADVDYRNIDPVAVKATLNASKVFYYDSIDEGGKDAEQRRQHLDEIGSLDGFHVRKGTITGSNERKRRQKQVDVQLAVDALTHAFNKNCWHVSLVAGDLDFQPLVNALIQLGIHVHVWYESKSAARDLHRAADVSSPISISQFWDWSNQPYRRDHPRPHEVQGHDHDGQALCGRGTWQGKSIELYQRGLGDGFALLARGTGYMSSFWMTDPDPERLKEYFCLIHGPIQWQQDGQESRP